MKEFIKAVLGTPLITLLWNLLMVYICFMICRVAFVWYNWELYDGYLTQELLLNMFKGSLRFDTAAIMYLSIIYTFLTLLPLHVKEREQYYKVIRWVLIVCCSIGIVMNLADTVYYQFSGKRTTISARPVIILRRLLSLTSSTRFHFISFRARPVFLL